LVVGLVTLGLGLRLTHYLRDPTMWHDEAACVLNVLRKSFGDLLGPLYFSEAAPPLFLWVERASALLLGSSTYALRLFPLLASCLALVGLVTLGRRLLRPEAVVWLALLAACSDKWLWHTREAKPYSGDVLAGTLVLALFMAGRVLTLPRQLLLAALVAIPLVFLSYPACFLLGGLALSLLPAVIRRQSLFAWFGYAVYLAALGGSFLVLFAGPIRAQRDAAIMDCWQFAFPNWDRPWTVPGWLVQRSLDVFRYAYEPTGGVLAVAALVGVTRLWRAGQRRLVVLLLSPIGLALAAALLHRYPYGAFRTMVFTAPAALLLMAEGLPSLFARLRRWGRWAPLVPAAVVGVPAAAALFHVVKPWPLPDARSASAYVQAHRGADDPVVGTVWEHEYYFRDLPSCYYELGKRVPPPGPGQAWLLASGNDPNIRGWFRDQLLATGPWQVAEQVEFQRLTVYRLTRDEVIRADDEPAARSGPPRNRP
jgi:hypothetical protein